MNPTRRSLLKNTALICTGLSSSLKVMAIQEADSSLPGMAHSPKRTSDVLNERASCEGVLSHTLRPLAGSESAPLCDSHSGQVLLLVNTASKCGFAPQFEALESLHQRYQDRGFAVLGFPSGDFLQEFDEENAVAEFCKENYGVSFPMYQKISVTGQDAHPLYKDLAAATRGFPRWNFYKYLVDRNGRIIDKYPSSEQPMGDRLIQDIESLL